MRMATMDDPIVIDEWTSVVDRNVARVMSHTIQKFARRSSRSVILLSCHYDVLDWLDPDWVIDCNKETFIDRRLLQRHERERVDKLQFEIRSVDGQSWKRFSKYHYLSAVLPGGLNFYFGLFLNGEQIGFQAYSEYVPRHIERKNKIILHSNRVVVHPDYVGLGLGMKLVDATAHEMNQRGFRIMAKFSSIPMFKSRSKNPKWVFLGSDCFTPPAGGNMIRKTSFRQQVQFFRFEYRGERNSSAV
jgi:GNAT superfamily N-acetyltransferase